MNLLVKSYLAKKKKEAILVSNSVTCNVQDPTLQKTLFLLF